MKNYKNTEEPLLYTSQEIDIYDMKLHEEAKIGEYNPVADYTTNVMRVPGGWIYRSYDKSNGIMASSFVPFNAELSTKVPKPTPKPSGGKDITRIG